MEKLTCQDQQIAPCSKYSQSKACSSETLMNDFRGLEIFMSPKPTTNGQQLKNTKYKQHINTQTTRKVFYLEMIDSKFRLNTPNTHR